MVLSDNTNHKRRKYIHSANTSKCKVCNGQSMQVLAVEPSVLKSFNLFTTLLHPLLCHNLPHVLYIDNSLFINLLECNSIFKLPHKHVTWSQYYYYYYNCYNSREVSTLQVYMLCLTSGTSNSTLSSYIFIVHLMIGFYMYTVNTVFTSNLSIWSHS